MGRGPHDRCAAQQRGRAGSGCGASHPRPSQSHALGQRLEQWCVSRQPPGAPGRSHSAAQPGGGGAHVAAAAAGVRVARPTSLRSTCCITSLSDRTRRGKAQEWKSTAGGVLHQRQKVRGHADGTGVSRGGGVRRDQMHGISECEAVNQSGRTRRRGVTANERGARGPLPGCNKTGSGQRAQGEKGLGRLGGNGACSRAPAGKGTSAGMSFEGLAQGRLGVGKWGGAQIR